MTKVANTWVRCLVLTGALAMTTPISGSDRSPTGQGQAAPAAEEVRRFTVCDPGAAASMTQSVKEFRVKEGRIVCGCHYPTERFLVMHDYVNDRTIYRKPWNLDKYNGASVSPDGARAVSWDNRNRIYLWNIETGEEIRRFGRHEDDVVEIWWMPDGRRFMSSGADANWFVWDSEAEKGDAGQIATLAAGKDCPQALTFRADGTQMAVGVGGVVRVYDADTFKVTREFPRLVDPTQKHLGNGVFEGPGGNRYAAYKQGATDIDAIVKRLKFSSDGRHLAVGAGSATIVVFDTHTGRQLARRQEQVNVRSEVTALDVSPDGRRILYSTTSGPVRLWDWTTDRIICELKGHTRQRQPEHAGQPGGVEAVAFTNDGDHALSAGEDGTVRMWRLPK